jgi:hypothetical protein
MGINEEWFNDGSFIASKKALREPFTVADSDGTIDTLEGTVSYPAGFYILTGPKGEQYPMSPEKFQTLKVDNGDGTATPIKIEKWVKFADHSGSVETHWGETLNYVPGDVIVRHGENEYGVVKPEIFQVTYDS